MSRSSTEVRRRVPPALSVADSQADPGKEAGVLLPVLTDGDSAPDDLMTNDTPPPPQLGRVAGEALLRVAQRLTALLADLAAQQSLTPLQARLLRALRDRPSQGELARQLACDPSRISVLTGELEESGLVRRTPSRSDRRVRLTRLTEAGERAVSAIGAGLAERSPLDLRLSPEELTVLVRLLDKLEADDREH
ncbi:MarR family winged helix-turn-helix transcriptional regulator [Actinorugispora endophytica]|uniref:DNA-binding MarR family transcriptional regulator n=1 Tax=Actinorugispora endophytica TaxID=1605990 RepID=A0A4R6UR55_9ACTN|nr:MarR family transcriptional regulator [Actinorugispora endophytica]TDQ48229.1 DNA-binding MarR family transcriptional regulator [Actinorugispora endophytica]